MTSETRKISFVRLLTICLAAVLAVGLASCHSSGVHLPTPPADPLGKPTFDVSEIKAGDDLKIVAYGDMRFTDPKNTSDTNPRVRKWLVDRIAQEKPDALFVSGDLPFHGSTNADWNRYRLETAPWTQARLRVYPTIGNHELVPSEPQGLANYFEEFPWLQGRRYYSVKLGCVYLISLDSNAAHKDTAFDEGSPQLEWLKDQLAHIPAEINFVVVLTHMPLVNDVQSEVVAGLPESTEVRLRRYLEKQSAQSHAKFIVVSGHVHNYERFELGGVSYIISGGGGAKPYPIYVRNPLDLYKDPAYPNFNYLVLLVHAKQADVTMYRVADPEATTLTTQVKEKFTLTAK